MWSFIGSGWLCARRMSASGHQVHTAAVFVKVNGAPVRASVEDAQFYVDWMDELLQRTSAGGVWASYFPTKRAQAQARYQAAKSLYQQIALEAANSQPVIITTSSLPDGFVNLAYSATLTASGGITPYTWSLASGSLSAGLTLNTNTGVITGTPTTLGTSSFAARVTDAGNPAQTATQALSIVVNAVPLSGLIGNTNNGSLSDIIWASGAWINAGRFQAASNVTVTTMQAKVAGVAGKYKCALYTGNSGQPSRLLGSTVEVTSPATGWLVFPLTTAVALANGGYYWLAIWSDDAAARVYYSSSSGGTLRWGQYDYGPWPDPISTSSGSDYQYCIYAYGATATAPVASDLVAALPEDTTTNLTLLGQGGQGPLTYAILTGPTNGNVGSLNPNTGAVSYTPNLDYNGPDTFRYTVGDGSQQATGTVSLTISAVNDAPTLALATNYVEVPEDSGTVVTTNFALMTAGPANEAGQSITNVAVLNVSNAALFAVGPVISPGGTLTFTPAANGNGVALATVQARDNGGTANGGTNGSGAQTFAITVMAVNDPPVAWDQSVTNAEDTAVVMVLGGGDVDGPVTNFSVVASPAHGQLVPQGGAEWVYQPDTNYFGLDSFTFQADDGSLTSAVATVSLTVTPVNDAPAVSDDTYTLGNGATLDIPAPGVLSNDSDPEGDGLTAGLVSGPVQGVLNLSAAGGFSYTPTNHFSGAETFTYQASDGQTNSGPATVSIMVSNSIQISLVSVSNEVVTVTWSAIAGKKYRLQYKDDWAEEVWTDLLPDVISAGLTASESPAIGATSQRYYRVKCLAD